MNKGTMEEKSFLYRLYINVQMQVLHVFMPVTFYWNKSFMFLQSFYAFFPFKKHCKQIQLEN